MRTDRPILIFGGTGQLGTALCERLDVARRPYVAPSPQELDLRVADSVERAVDGSGALAVVNAAAYTDVTRANLEQERPVVDALNRDAPAAMATACRRRGIPLVHVSTDYVFDGASGRPYVETDTPRPLQVYGLSKLEGERRVLVDYPQAIVARTSTVFGRNREGRSNYVDAILRQAREKDRFSVVRLPIASPTWSVDLAYGLLRLLDVRAEGLVHVVNGGSCSRLELARASVRAAGLDAVRIEERPAPETGVRRPDFSALDGTRFAELVGEGLQDWERAVAAYVRATSEG